MYTFLAIEEQIFRVSSFFGRVQAFKRSHLNSESLRAFFSRFWLTVAYLLCIGNLLLSMFSATFLVAAAVAIVLAKKIVQKKLEKIAERGLISYLSPRLRHVLMHRSIFDILCDQWYLHNYTLYVQSFIGPFFFKPEPKIVIKSLEMFSERDRKIFLTKGILYVLPKWLRERILPKSYKLHNKILEFMEIGDVNIERLKASSQQALPLGSSEPKLFSRFESTNALPAEKDSDFSNLFANRKNSEEDFLEEDNKIIIGSAILKQLKHLPGKTSETWDNIHLYKMKEERRRMRKEALERDHSLNDAAPKPKQGPISPLTLVKEIIESKKKKLLSKLSVKKLIAISSVCVLGVGGQLYFTKKHRKLAIHFLAVLSYAGLLGAGVGSLAILGLKIREKNLANRFEREMTGPV